jgi:hypothetical protein
MGSEGGTWATYNCMSFWSIGLGESWDGISRIFAAELIDNYDNYDNFYEFYEFYHSGSTLEFEIRTVFSLHTVSRTKYCDRAI